MVIIAIIPARGGSKGVPNKNIAKLNNIPLIAWTIFAAKNVREIKHIVVSTDSEEIKKISIEFGADLVVDRPAHLSTDYAPTLAAIQHAAKVYEETFSSKIDYVVTLQPTSPLRNSTNIRESLEKILESDADSLISCIKVPTIFQAGYQLELLDDDFVVPSLTSEHNTPRQLKKIYVARNGSAIYITKRELLDKYLFGGKCVAYFMNLRQSLDIDDVKDFQEAEKLLKG